MFRSFYLFTRDVLRTSGSLGVRAATFTLAGAFLEGVGLVLLLPLVNVIGNVGSGGGVVDKLTARLIAALPGNTVGGQLAVLLLIFAVLMFMRGVVILQRDVSMARLQTGFLQGLRLRVVEALARADWSVLTRLRHGRISHVLSSDIRSCGLAAQLTLQSAVAATLLCVQMVLATLLSPPIALLVLGLLAVGALLLRPTMRQSRDLGVQLTEASFRLTDDTGQFLGGLKLAFSQNLQDRFVDEFSRTIAAGAAREVAFARQRSRTQIALTSFAATVAGLALLLGFTVLATSPASLVALLIVLARMSGPVAQLQQNLQYIAHSLPAYDKIGELKRDLSMYGNVRSMPFHKPVFGGALTLRNASYHHDCEAMDDKPGGVRDASLMVTQGEFLGISGPSGAGKTTLVDLMIGLLPPQSGSISIGDVSLDKASLPAWRDRVSYVSQDPFLFHESIAQNLRWARPEADEEEIWKALVLAGAADMVRALPYGLATVVGERGSLLSGGERQRIALARAIIRRPLLLVLDEATNAIDVDGERAVLNRLVALQPRPTIVMVAHREQSLALCERIITVEAGRIVADVRSATLGQVSQTA